MKKVIIIIIIALMVGIAFAQTGTGVIRRFLELTDVTPSTYTGQASKVVTVNAGGTALEFTAAGNGDLLANGTVPMTANWDIGNFDITLKALTGDGTIEGATLTEGGNAVYSSGETPSGELGGTYANITIDDSVAVSGWTLTNPYVSGIVYTNADMNLRCDADNNGSNEFSFTNGGGTEVAYLNESGNFQFDGTLTVGAVQWDDGSSKIDGEQLAADTVDNDSIDWGDMTDLTTDGAVVWGNIAEGELADAIIVDADIKDDVIQEPALNTTNAAGAGTDNYLLSYNHAGTNYTWVAAIGGGTMSSFFAEDGDTTEVEIDDTKEWKFVEGTGIDIDWTDTDGGTDADPFDLTFTVALGTDIAAAEMANADHGDVQWDSGDADVESMDLGDATTGTYYVGLFADDTGTSRPIYADAPLSYAQATGTLTAGEFSGGGGSLTGIDAATGDSATAFFDAGTIEHEWGGLQANVAAYTGLIAITGADTTAEIDAKSELEGQIADVSDFAEADGDTWTGTHDLSGATVTMPKRTKNDDRFYALNLWNPNGMYDNDTQVLIDPNLPANITITEVTISCDADPTTELDLDLKWADAFIGLGNATLIEPIDTTDGTTDIDSGFDDATVVATKCLYLEFGADPDSGIKQAVVKIRYDFD